VNSIATNPSAAVTRSGASGAAKISCAKSADGWPVKTIARRLRRLGDRTLRPNGTVCESSEIFCLGLKDSWPCHPFVNAQLRRFWEGPRPLTILSVKAVVPPER
jgi:hypothetical protein